MKSFFLTFSLLAFALSFSAEAYANSQTPKKLGRYSYWSVFKMGSGEKATCYMSLVAKPPKTKKKLKKKRGDVTLMITHRPAEGALDVVSYAVGAKLKPAKSMKAIVGDKRFDLFTHADTGWARDAATDRSLTMALRAGYYVTFLGELSSGESFADSVNLKGSAKAYDIMSKACGIEVLSVPLSARPKSNP